MKKYISANGHNIIGSTGYQNCLTNINKARDAIEDYKNSEAFTALYDKLAAAHNAGDTALRDNIISATDDFLFEVNQALDKLNGYIMIDLEGRE